MRILHESDYNKGKIFITLTYSNEYIDKDMSLRKDHVQRFIKRLRINIGERKIKYYICGEYGDITNRPHYHGIILGLNIRDREVIEKSWDNGFISVSNLTIERINYVTDYITKKLYGEKAEKKYGKRQREFALMSKGLGLNWIKDIENENHVLVNLGVRHKGRVLPIPRYYVKKMDTEIPKEVWEERKRLNAEKEDEKANKNWSEDLTREERKRMGRAQLEIDEEALRRIKGKGKL